MDLGQFERFRRIFYTPCFLPLLNLTRYQVSPLWEHEPACSSHLALARQHSCTWCSSTAADPARLDAPHPQLPCLPFLHPPGDTSVQFLSKLQITESLWKARVEVENGYRRETRVYEVGAACFTPAACCMLRWGSGSRWVQHGRRSMPGVGAAGDGMRTPSWLYLCDLTDPALAYGLQFTMARRFGGRYDGYWVRGWPEARAADVLDMLAVLPPGMDSTWSHRPVPHTPLHGGPCLLHALPFPSSQYCSSLICDGCNDRSLTGVI